MRLLNGIKGNYACERLILNIFRTSCPGNPRWILVLYVCISLIIKSPFFLLFSSDTACTRCTILILRQPRVLIVVQPRWNLRQNTDAQSGWETGQALFPRWVDRWELRWVWVILWCSQQSRQGMDSRKSEGNSNCDWLSHLASPCVKHGPRSTVVNRWHACSCGLSVSDSSEKSAVSALWTVQCDTMSSQGHVEEASYWLTAWIPVE